MKVRAKFKVEKVVTTVDGGCITLVPVTAGSEENEKFYKYTPYGGVELGTINLEAAKQFSPGTEFYVDFIKAE